MKKSLLVVIAVFSLVSVMFGQNLIPPLESHGFSLQASGYGQGVWGDKPLVGDALGRKAAWQTVTMRLDLKTPSSAVKFYGEVEFWGIDEENANWLSQAFLEVKATDSITFRVGRMLLSGGYVTPASDCLETVHYPRVPWPVYGNGFQMEIKFCEDWKVIADFSGDTSLHFDDSDLYKKAETSARLTKSFNKINLTLAGQIALAEDLKIYGVDFDWRPDKLHLKGALYVVDNTAGGWYRGGYLFAGYTLFDHVELHSQIDFRSEIGKSSTIWTNGVRVWSPRDQVEITVDHEAFFEQGKVDNRFFARLEVRF